MKNSKVQTYDFRSIRNINDRVVLNLILENRVVSGADLARLTGMRPSTTSNIIKGLHERDLVTFLGKGESTNKGGKRPYLWEINGDSVYAIGMDVEIGQVAITMLGLNGSVKDELIYKTDKLSTPEELSDQLLESVNDLIKRTKVDEDRILGIGIAIAGIVNRDTGNVIMTDIIPHMNFSLTRALAKRYDFPIIAENNANASAIGSKIVGSARGQQDFMSVLIKVDSHVSGIGIGLVLNGELYHGNSFSSGEITAEFPPMYNMISRLRDKFSEGKILRKFENNIEDLNIRILIDSALEGDELALHYFSLLGRMIGTSIAKHIAMINPAQVIITGEIAELGDIVLDPIMKIVKYELVSASMEQLEILMSKSGSYSVAIGAASIILNEFLKVPTFKASQQLNGSSK